MNLASVCVLLYCGGEMIMGGSLTVGQFVAFQQYTGRIDASWQAVVTFLQSLTSSAASAERVLAILELEPVIGAPRHALMRCGCHTPRCHAAWRVAAGWPVLS